MFQQSAFSSPFASIHQSAPNNEIALQNRALDLYNDLQIKRRLWHFLFSIAHKPADLIDLNHTARKIRISGRHYMGIQNVAIHEIKGSEGRLQNFDKRFYPITANLRNRWLSVASARLKGLPLPPVELIRLGEVYFVRDGHHRISVARALGEKYIAAEVIQWDASPATSVEKQVENRLQKVELAMQCVL